MEQGLKAAKSEIFMIDEVRADGRVPGLKEAPEILIFIDEVKARSENMEFDYDAKEGTWKTRGIDGVIRPWFFQKVVDQRAGPGRGNVLFQSKEDPLMQANKVPKVVRPKFLLHATFWENVDGILREGLVPAKNPLSSTRRPFKNLLQGAESHVYTLRGGQSAPRLVEEQEPAAQAQASNFEIDKDRAGLDRRPDAIFVIDTKKAADLGIDLELVQSSDREDNIYVRGSVPAKILSACEPNIPTNLPDALKAKIVDPKSFEDVPIIDLCRDEAALVDEIRYACEVVGFMQVTGHGISEQLQQKHMDLQKKFFELPQAVKDRLKLSDESPVRGWFGRGGEDLDQVLEKQVDEADGKDTIKKARKDLKEALDCNGVPFSRPVGGYIAEIFAQPSQLPTEAELGGFRAVLDEYVCCLSYLCMLMW
ncbi:2ODD33 [Symbiodinium natans]|uniref:2ODD33 protein n=1 Tax=Symbiodinium natans TaxID=878477 RepID=A0A812T0V7_9DINO|nr:2ODD33 [Symbiodinium natans]